MGIAQWFHGLQRVAGDCNDIRRLSGRQAVQGIALSEQFGGVLGSYNNYNGALNQVAGIGPWNRVR